MADTATTATTATTEAVQQATETTNNNTTSTPTTTTPGDNTLKRSHPEYNEKTKEELVETEKRKIQKIQTLVHEVQEGTREIDAKIAVAKESKDIEERKELITDIQTAAAEVKEKVISAARLEGDVAEINTVLKEKKKAEDAAAEDGESVKPVAPAATTTTETKAESSIPTTSTQ